MANFNWRLTNGTKLRKDVKVAYTRHDMRRGFNLAAKEAGMSLDDRALLLGHGRNVNESHYGGKPELDAKKISEILHNKMWTLEKVPEGSS